MRLRCRHCGTWNSDDEHRCGHCGRRLLAPVPLENTSAAPQLDPEPAAAPPPPAERPRMMFPPRQASLFADRSKVIPFEALAPERPRGSRPPLATSRAASGAATIPQPAFDFQPRILRVEPAVRDAAPIAPRAIRLRAALIDAFVCGVGFALLLGVFHLMGGTVVVNAKTAPGYAGALAALVAFYRLYWSILGRETAGMRCSRIRVLTFDGDAPGWGLRVARFAAACLGAGALGIGFVWALFDEEGLAWHDHISKTFPTVYHARRG